MQHGAELTNYVFYYPGITGYNAKYNKVNKAYFSLTYSPVENIPTVNTTQAHDRRFTKSIELKKKILKQHKHKEQHSVMVLKSYCRHSKYTDSISADVSVFVISLCNISGF